MQIQNLFQWFFFPQRKRISRKGFIKPGFVMSGYKIALKQRLPQLPLTCLSLSGSKRNSCVHNESISVRFDVLLLQSAPGRVNILLPRLASRQLIVSAVSAVALWTFGCFAVYGPRNYHQPLRDDWTSYIISKVSTREG